MDLFRSLLFVPGNQPRMLQKASLCDPDVFVPDLEDSVAVGDKEEARETVRAHIELLSSTGRPVIPRLNSLDTGLLKDDLSAIAVPGVFGVSVGKVGDIGDIAEIIALMDSAERNAGLEIGSIKLLPWIETASGVINSFSILSASERVCGAAFGAEDFTNDMGIERREDSREIMHAKNHLAITAKAAMVPALDTPFFAFRDTEGLNEDSIFSRSIGYKGKFAIHPDQIQTINACFSPNEKEIEHARKIIEVFDEAAGKGRGSTSLDGVVVDVPVVKRARALLDLAEDMKLLG